ncbi:MAG: DUF664 domain-containing protein [Pseudonocardiaceae bacterium]
MDIRQRLELHRAQLLTKLEGLDGKQAARRQVGSLTTLHGLVRHMTAVDHWWFVTVIGGVDEPIPCKRPGDRDADFRLDGSEDLDVDVSRYLAQCSGRREALGSTA